MNPRTRSQTWKRRVRNATSDRLALKATAMALAIVLWFTVSVREPAEQIVRVSFQPSLEPGVVLAEEPPPVRALVRGSGRDLLKLYSTPPAIRMSIGGEVGDSLTVALRPSDIDLPPGVTAIVRDVQPRRITLAFRHRQGALPDSDDAAWARPITPTPPPADTAEATLIPPLNPGAVDTASRVLPAPGAQPTAPADAPAADTSAGTPP